ncbi:hypothetical protein MMC09_002421 [Bachmanniomyces sp. S44760]|nr:hypothetical protein [Bachmanniomyces sp. S44760]
MEATPRNLTPPLSSNGTYRSPKRKRETDYTTSFSPCSVRLKTDLPIHQVSARDSSPRTGVARQLQGLDLRTEELPSISKLDFNEIRGVGEESSDTVPSEELGGQVVRGCELSLGQPVQLPPPDQDDVKNRDQFKDQGSADAPLSSARFSRPSSPIADCLPSPKSIRPPATTTPHSPPKTPPLPPLEAHAPCYPSPPPTSLIWLDSEITGHEPTDPSDDGYGINGIGFRPTPALAYQRAQKRKQQVKEWKEREGREARGRRIERRRGQAGRSEEDRDARKDESVGMEPESGQERKVRFVEG